MACTIVSAGLLTAALKMDVYKTIFA